MAHEHGRSSTFGERLQRDRYRAAPPGEDEKPRRRVFAAFRIALRAEPLAVELRKLRRGKAGDELIAVRSRAAVLRAEAEKCAMLGGYRIRRLGRGRQHPGHTCRVRDGEQDERASGALEERGDSTLETVCGVENGHVGQVPIGSGGLTCLPAYRPIWVFPFAPSNQ